MHKNHKLKERKRSESVLRKEIVINSLEKFVENSEAKVNGRQIDVRRLSDVDEELDQIEMVRLGEEEAVLVHEHDELVGPVREAGPDLVVHNGLGQIATQLAERFERVLLRLFEIGQLLQECIDTLQFG